MIVDKTTEAVYEIVQRSYDTREKILDWMLAIFVVAFVAYFYKTQWKLPNKPNLDINYGKIDAFPDQNVEEAIGNGQPVGNLYTYNMPPARNSFKIHVGPTSVRMPFNPKYGPQYSVEYEEIEGRAWKGDRRND